MKQAFTFYPGKTTRAEVEAVWPGLDDAEWIDLLTATEPIELDDVADPIPVPTPIPTPVPIPVPKPPADIIAFTGFEPDLKEAERFLKLLDPAATRFTFQTFDDVLLTVGDKEQKRGNKDLTHVYHGTLAEHAAALAAANAQGGGVYVVVNKTNLQGRSAVDITDVRDIWREGDEPGLREKRPLPLEPDVVVESSEGKFHEHILVREYMSFADHRGIEEHLVAEWGSCKGAKDIARVLRLPGFFNNKRRQFRVRIVDGRALKPKWKPYTNAEIIKAFPPFLNTGGNETPREWNASRTDWRDKVSKKLWKLIQTSPEQEPGQGKRGRHAFKVMSKLREIGCTDQDIYDAATDEGAGFADKYFNRGDLGKEIIRSDKNRKKKAGKGFAPVEGFEAKQTEPEPEASGSGGAPPPKEPPAGSTEEQPPEPEPGLIEWPDTNDENKPRPNSMRNVAALLKGLGTKARRNSFTGNVELLKRAGWVEWRDADINRLWALAQQKGLPTKFDAFYRLLMVVADEVQCHPVREYLAGLTWDGVPRIDECFVRYCGADDTPLNRAISRLVFLGAVSRVMTPGCKFDFLTVLRGPQGNEKSKFIRRLGEPFFSDSLRIGSAPRETIEETSGVWIMELAELDGMSSREAAAVKAFLSRQNDRARAAWGKVTANVPRQWIAIGTCNDEEPLRDPTGNRRFLPVVCKGTIDTEGVKAIRDQLWAEAAARVAKGERAELPRDLWQAAAEVQEAHRVKDAVEERLVELLTGLNGVVAKEDLWEALGRKDAANRTQKEMNALTRTMRRLGWVAGRRRKYGDRTPTYEKECETWLRWQGKHFAPDNTPQGDAWSGFGPG